MDAISMVVPSATTATLIAANGDGRALEAGVEGQTPDFASLLAAGLLPPLPMPVLAPAAPALPEDEAALQEVAPAPPFDENVLDASSLLAASGATPIETRKSPPAAPAEIHAWQQPHAPHALEEPIARQIEAATLAGAAVSGAMEDAREAHAKSALDVTALEGRAGPLEAGMMPAPILQVSAEKDLVAQPTAMLEVSSPVGTPDFPRSLSQQVVWMADKGAQVAELRINPPELGPIEIRLQLNGDDAAVQFVSAHAEVRNAIESALARLRESMAEAGIQLGEASVSAESFRERPPSEGQQRGGGERDNRRVDGGWNTLASVARVHQGLVDLFA